MLCEITNLSRFSLPNIFWALIHQIFSLQSFVLAIQYRTVQNFDRGNIDKFDEFLTIRQYFPIKIFRLVSYLYEMNE